VTTESPRQVAESYWAAECRRDTRAVLDHYHPDAVFRLPNQLLRGHDQIATFYDASGAEYPGLEVQIVGEVSAGDSAALEWEATLVDRSGRPHELRGVNIVEVRDGKFTSVRAYFDPSAFGTIAQEA
jgi:ketosteroid isomerase-like protein